MKKITAKELKHKLEKGEVVLIDVREPAEHRGEHIEGAYLIPLDSINLEKLPSTDKPFVIHCRSGRRSMEACKKLLKENPSLELHSLDGGIVSWQDEGFHVNKSSSNILPLDRQTQVTVGFLALSGTLLGTFVEPAFYIIPGFVGTGLMFAGITGWCGMAKLLAKMPWNQ